ncbi:MAG: tetratricopeptide repeat protein, partial [Oscillospiraceae bacterium]|nr:tetratricopeptide repeat protein [Oscillospiraceae bacterium]
GGGRGSEPGAGPGAGLARDGGGPRAQAEAGKDTVAYTATEDAAGHDGAAGRNGAGRGAADGGPVDRYGRRLRGPDHEISLIRNLGRERAERDPSGRQGHPGDGYADDDDIARDDRRRRDRGRRAYGDGGARGGESAAAGQGGGRGEPGRGGDGYERESLPIRIVKYILLFAVGVLATILFTMFVSFPPVDYAPETGTSPTADGGETTHAEGTATDDARHELELFELRTRITELEEANEGLLESLEAAYKEISAFKYSVYLSEAEEAFEAGRLKESSSIIAQMDPILMVESDRASYNALLAKFTSSNIDAMLTELNNEINEGRYESCLEYLKDVVPVIDVSGIYKARVLYYMGKCYEGLDEIDKAIEAYKEVTDNYPTSNFHPYARDRYNALV